MDAFLKEDFSPEQINGFLKANVKEYVSHETIYLYIWKDKRTGDKLLFKHLRRKGRHYAKRGSKTNERGFIKNRVDIDRDHQSLMRKLGLVI